MKKMTANEIRLTWLKFWESKGHYIEPSASLIPHNDPTLLWINAGVAALKKYFDGREIPTHLRITNAQKAIRTNDIENVGKTARHHTFFEMLGNFSIGDYFRNEVIPWAFELLTSDKYFGFPTEKLYMTVHPNDKATQDLWIKCGVDPTHLIPLEGNFWEIGEGPCGPDTEIFFDRGEKYDPQGLGIKLLKDDIENDRYIEIWNIVFSQYNSEIGVARENYKELPSKNIDTGAGLERFACVIQEKETNFDTDLFFPIIEATSKLTKEKYEDNKMAYRVIADHVRTCTFALSDGASFSNEGRGYVLRRILRRAMRYGRKLGIVKPFLYQLVDVCVEMMKDFYPYIIEKKALVSKMILAEEEKFLKTLNSGEVLLKKMIENVSQLSGEDAFKLYDTYGFPFELTLEIAEENNVTVDKNGFDECMKAQKERARAARGDLQSMNKQSKDLMEFTESSSFVYELKDVSSKVIGLFKDGVKVDSIEDEGDVIFENTNFYAEMGGQVADLGTIENNNVQAEVTNVIKAPNKQHLHHVNVLYGSINVGDEFTLKIDKQRRLKIMRNHSSCHLLQSALIQVLGEGLHQQGSYVDDQVMRFDFNYDKKISEAELNQIERLVNDYIASAIEEVTHILPIEEAKKLGATALFDEKYGDVVRVVCFGNVSKEFCGGTHVFNSEDIGCFAIEFEESIAAGTRRIQARTGSNAYELMKSRENILIQMRNNLGAGSITEAIDRLKSNLNEKEDLKKENKSLKDKIAASQSKEMFNDVISVGNHQLLMKHIDGTGDAMLKLLDSLKAKLPEAIIVLIASEDNKHSLVVKCSDKAINSGLKAGDIIKTINGILGGRGGGKPDMARGSVDNVNDFDKAFAKVKELLA
ncbi:MAG: alanine--tRNA ligase [Bacilli bacterium]|nr:alanine--tRNA ligase [Bacilli bacterium]